MHDHRLQQLDRAIREALSRTPGGRFISLRHVHEIGDKLDPARRRSVFEVAVDAFLSNLMGPNHGRRWERFAHDDDEQELVEALFELTYLREGPGVFIDPGPTDDGGQLKLKDKTIWQENGDRVSFRAIQDFSHDGRRIAGGWIVKVTPKEEPLKRGGKR